MTREIMLRVEQKPVKVSISAECQKLYYEGRYVDLIRRMLDVSFISLHRRIIYNKSLMDTDDFKQEFAVLVLTLIDKYDEKFNCSFYTYVMFCAKNLFANLGMKSLHGGNQISFQEAFMQNNNNINYSSSGLYNACETKEVIENLVCKYSQREKEIFFSYYGIMGYEKLKLTEVAKRCNVKEQFVRNIINKMWRRMKIDIKNTD